MARREVIELVDDLDGGPVTDDGETIQFTYRGVEYEIDLRSKNAAKLDKALEPYLSAARRVGGRRTRGSGRGAGAPANRSHLSAIRDWARANGHEVSDRGRISREIQEAYQQAH